MKKQCSFLVVLLLCAVAAAGQSYKKIAVTSGASIIDGNGKSIILKGTNLGNWLVPEGYMFKTGNASSSRKIDELLNELIGPDSTAAFWNRYLDRYITYDDIKYLKRIGCNHVRVPFHYKMFTQDMYMGARNAGFKYLDRVVEWCRKENLYVLLDMHCAPGGQTGDNIDDSYGYPWLFFSKGSQDETAEIWKEIAKHYKNDPIILGYDLINEPLPHYFTGEIKDYNARLLTFYERLVKDIRSIDKKHIIFLSGSVWGGDFGVFTKLPDSNVVYEFHKYWFDVNQEAVQRYLDFSALHKVAVYIGETGENTDEWVRDFRLLLDKNAIHWCFWPYKKMDNTKGIMNFSQPDDYPLITKYADSDRSNFAGIRKNMPDRLKVQKALIGFLENCHYKHNFQNEGYIQGLGFALEKR